VIPAFTAGNALGIELLVDAAEELSLNVHCREYANYFKALGEPEFGAMLTCEIDPPMTAAIGDDLILARTKTVMGGAGHCDFRWKLARPDRE